MKGIDILISPPIAFVLFLIAAALLFRLGRRMAPKLNNVGGKLTSYACGEDMPSSLIQPDYGAFFPFAFLFTILHVVALMVATAPMNTPGSFTMAVIYLAGAITALFILFRR